jgi:hypothetical protein
VQNNQPFIYTEDQLMARLKFFIGVCLTLTLTGIVFVVLYSIMFVTQPLNAISPVDQKFFEFLTGTLSGIMLAGSKKEDQDAFLAAQKQAQDTFDSARKASMPLPTTSVSLGNGISLTTTGMNQNSTFQNNPSQVVIGFGGKPSPPPAPQPEI